MAANPCILRFDDQEVLEQLSKGLQQRKGEDTSTIGAKGETHTQNLRLIKI